MLFIKRMYLFIFVFFIGSFDLLAEQFLIKEVSITCVDEILCERYSNYKQPFEGKKLSSEQILDRFRFLLNETTIESMSYEILKDGEEYYIDLKIIPRKLISELNVVVDEEVNLAGLYKSLSVAKGGIYSSKSEDKVKSEIENYLKDFGLKVKKIDYEVKNESEGAVINIKINTTGAKKIYNISIGPPSVPEIYKRRFLSLRGTSWDKGQFKIELDHFIKELQLAGYIYAKVDKNEEREGKDNKINLDVLLNLGTRVNVSFYGNKLVTRDELKNEVLTNILNSSLEVSESELKKTIISKYEEQSVYGTSVNLKIQNGKDISGTMVQTYFFVITEGSKFKVDHLNFVGNEHFSDDFLLSIYDKFASDLATSQSYDSKYLESYIGLIKDEYLKNGFGLVKITKNEIMDKKNKTVSIEIKIKEKHQCILKEIEIKGVGKDLELKLKEMLNNKENSPLNYISLDQDLKAISSYLKDQGYYFAHIISEVPEEILFFDETYSEAHLKLNIKTEKKIVLDDVLVIGNIKTKTEVILRELNIENGQIITISALNEFREKLNSLGLFLLVKTTPIPFELEDGPDQNKDLVNANLLVQVKEKDFGILEIAPGFRTDIGLKLSFGITYNNIRGKNLSNALRTQLNQRLDYSNLDSRRRGEQKRRIELAVENMFTLPYTFGIPLRLDLSGSAIRRRYYSFDADIFRGAVQFSKSLTQKIETTLRYQVEAIQQFDATNDKDDRFYRIGSITPALTFDFRDNNINPHKGAFFTLSTEFANPFLWSINNEQLVINYVKVISRNRFYIPMGPSWSLALAASYGYQENLDKSTYQSGDKSVSRGVIPSIKVFRLDGIDTVRGYADNEINRLEDKRDISETVIDNKAYFLNFKFEPRYNINDNMVIGPFFDAGRVYKDTIRLGALRSSVGITYKYLTPVGSLDFDYGVKTTKETDISGNQEKFGRFHLSIGFF